MHETARLTTSRQDLCKSLHTQSPSGPINRLSATAVPSRHPQTRLGTSERDCRTGASLQEASSAAPPSPSAATQAVNEYTELRQKLLSRAKKGSGFLAGYIFLQQGLVATSCSLLGSFAGYVYLKSLMQSVESYTGDSEVPLVSAQQISSQPWRAIMITFAVYRQALSPRLLIPMSLAAGIFLFNATQTQTFTLLQEFDVLLGFLFSYKSGLVLALYDDLKPKASSDDDVRPERPSLAAVADLEEDREVRLLRERQRR